MDTRKMVTAEEARRVMDDITPTEWDASPVGQSERRAEDRRLAARLTEISTWHEARRWVGTVVALHEDVRRFAALLAAATTERDEARAEVRRLTAALDAARRDEHCRPVQVVAGVAVRGGRVLLIRSKRHGVATPGGKVRIGETHADALRRELREETGLEVVRVGRYLHTDVQPAFQCHLYAVEVSESEPVAGDDAEAAWWGDPAEILASNIPRDYPLVLDVIRSGIGTHDDAPWFAAALDAARREGAEGMREAALRCCSPDDDHFD